MTTPRRLRVQVVLLEQSYVMDSKVKVADLVKGVAKELGRAYPELGDEFTLTSIELAFLTERLAVYGRTAAQPYWITDSTIDPASDPALRNGTWTPWR